ncbi:MAG: hypothetical protein ABIX46_00860 [Burkholderiaceae bacterium]
MIVALSLCAGVGLFVLDAKSTPFAAAGRSAAAASVAATAVTQARRDARP